jgi:hypothetical protein
MSNWKQKSHATSLTENRLPPKLPEDILKKSIGTEELPI